MNKHFDNWEENYAEWPMSLGAPDGTLEARQPEKILGSAPIDPARYYSPEFMRAEWDRLWPSTWLLAGVTPDIREAGDYTIFEIGHESFVIARQDDGSIKAFHNVCPHRGNRVCGVDRGSANGFSCPVHNWRFKLDGSLDKITEEDTFAAADIAGRPGMRAVRCDEIGGLIFINMEGDAPPLREWIGLPPGYIENYDIERMNMVRHVRSVWHANWKIATDIFYETYHLPHVHPQTKMMIEHYCQNDLYKNGFSRMIVPFGIPTHNADDQLSINPGLQSMLRDAGIDPASFAGTGREARIAMQRAKRARAPSLGLDNYQKLTDGQLSDGWITGLFPNVQIGFHAEGVFIMRFLPHESDPELMIYDNITLYRHVAVPDYNVPEWMGIPAGLDVTGQTPVEMEYYGINQLPDIGDTLLQDYHQVAALQKGMKSRAFARGPILSAQEQRIRYMHEEIDRYLSGEKQREWKHDAKGRPRNSVAARRNRSGDKN